VIGLDLGEAETEAFWRSFLRSLVDRGLVGVQQVVSEAHAGLKKAIAQVLGCRWQRCSVHFLREALGHARREQQPMLAALLRPIFTADDGDAARSGYSRSLSPPLKDEQIPWAHLVKQARNQPLLALRARPASASSHRGGGCEAHDASALCSIQLHSSSAVQLSI